MVPGLPESGRRPFFPTGPDDPAIMLMSGGTTAHESGVGSIDASLPPAFS